MGKTTLAVAQGRLSETDPAGSVMRSFCTFRTDERLYGIDVISIREVSTNMAITPVPHAPPQVRGLANLRSRILLVLDLGSLLGLAPAKCTPDSRLLILKPAVMEDAGILVDRGGDIIQIRQDRIEEQDASALASAATSASDVQSLVVGVCKLENELMMIIDATRFADTISKLLQ